MAKLNPKDPQFGIPVAARIKKEIADKFQNEAKEQGISFSKRLSDFLEQSQENAIKLQKAQANLENEKSFHKKIVVSFLLQLTDNNKAETQKLITLYKTIEQNERTK